MNYSQLAKNLMKRYSTKSCLLIFKDLSTSDIQNLLSHMNRLDYFLNLKNELGNYISKKRKNHIEKLLNARIKTLAA